MAKHLFSLAAALIVTQFSQAHLSQAQAADFTPPSKTFTADASGDYAMDVSHTSILFSTKHLGFSNYYGRFNKMEGTLNFDATDISKSKLSVKVFAASVDTNNSELEAKLQDAQFLNTEKFPMATFTSTKIEKLTDDTGRLTGDLTLLGVTKPITLDITFNGYAMNPYTQQPTLGFSAKGAFKRSDFGMNAYVPSVGDEVSLIIETEFNKTSSKE